MSYEFKYKLEELDNMYVKVCQENCELQVLVDLAVSGLTDPLACRVDARPGETNNGYVLRKIEEYRKGLEK